MPQPTYRKEGRPWQRLRRLVFATYGTDCWLCREGIDMQLTREYPNHRMAASVDHVVPLHSGGQEFDLSNCRPAHRSCNSKRGRQMQNGTYGQWDF